MNSFNQRLKVTEYLLFTTGFLCFYFVSENMLVNTRVFVYHQNEYEMLNLSHIYIYFCSICSKYTISKTNDHFSFPSCVLSFRYLC